ALERVKKEDLVKKLKAINYSGLNKKAFTARYDELSKKIASLEHRLGRKEDAIKKITKDFHKYEKKYMAVLNEYESVINSKSWALTRPLRHIQRIMNKIVKKIWS